MRQVTCVILIMVVLFSQGCGGRNAYPVQVTQPHDHNLSCNQLESELSRIVHEVNIKTGNKSSGDTKDVALAITGLVLFWPALFFMDLKNADKIELQALQSRHSYLLNIYRNKNCQ